MIEIDVLAVREHRDLHGARVHVVHIQVVDDGPVVRSSPLQGACVDHKD